MGELGMEEPQIEWDEPENEKGNVWAILGSGVSLEEVEDVFRNRDNVTLLTWGGGADRTTFGWASTGRFIAVSWEPVCGEPWTLYPTNAGLASPPGEQIHDPPKHR